MKELLGAFIAGRKLSDSETWKKRQLAVSLIMSVLAFVLYAVKLAGYSIDLSEEDRHAISEVFYIIVGMFGLFGAGATVATTTSIGLQDKSNSARAGGDVGGRDSVLTGTTAEFESLPMAASDDTSNDAGLSYLDNQRG